MQIRVHMATAGKNERDVVEGIHSYRMTVSGVSFKPIKVDEEIWGTYAELEKQIPALTNQTRRWPLSLRSRKKLKDLNQSWSEILDRQHTLMDVLTKAPKSVEFYNRIHLARIKKREQELRDAEIARKNAEAKEAIEKAISVIDQSKEGGGVATLGSTILRLDDARKYWDERLQEITSLETSAHMDPEELITVFKGLEDTISNAPAMAEEVKSVEAMFIRMMSQHEELATYGKSVISPEDLSRILIMVQEEIPRLWATGAWEKLRRSLNEVSSFVKFYDLPIRSELSLAERRKPGLTRAILMGANNLPLNQATPLLRSLVSAIDSRDRFMRGHSDTVARLVTQIARKMNWSGEDLEMVEIAALLHDVGKIAIPENVLTKIDPLTPEEWKTIQMHPYHGARIVKSLETLNRIIPWIYHHQERWDGGGYPDGLSKESIPAAARIIGVSEAYTVMITDQPKRKALTIDQAVNEIQKGAGTQFDPEVAEAFSEAVTTAISEETTPKQS
ncbi:MAG TPA: HD domain-containing phosphohydrolase [Anaerolineaceae bacterium]|nr:HD domain-containing phosphohydrolase [Anaerolineaceae bacterium]